MRSIYIYTLLFSLLIGGCGGKNIEGEIDQLRAQIASLDGRFELIEQWIQLQTNQEIAPTDSQPAEEIEGVTDLQAEIRRLEVRLHRLTNRAEQVDRNQQLIQDFAQRISTMDSQIGYLLTQNTNSAPDKKVSPPSWLHKVIWEEDGVIYAVGSSTNPRNGHKFAILNAKNALLEYLGGQTVNEVQILQMYQDNKKTFVLVSKVKEREQNESEKGEN